jgi:hypothetical protein
MGCARRRHNPGFSLYHAQELLFAGLYLQVLRFFGTRSHSENFCVSDAGIDYIMLVQTYQVISSFMERFCEVEHLGQEDSEDVCSLFLKSCSLQLSALERNKFPNSVSCR